MVDQDALVEALTSGHLGGAGIDVFPQEPTTESPLFGLPGVVVTPRFPTPIDKELRTGT